MSHTESATLEQPRADLLRVTTAKGEVVTILLSGTGHIREVGMPNTANPIPFEEASE